MSDYHKRENRKKQFLRGMRDGVPIGLGYFAVAFALGISAGNAGMNWFQSGLMSALMVASAGEYGAITVIAAAGSLVEMMVTTIIVNMRYLLMSCALSQKVDKSRSFIHRFFISLFVTDELFGIAVSKEGSFAPEYYYGASLVAVPMWVVGTSLGCAVGNIMPEAIGSSLVIALYGMFIAIVIPAAKKSRTLLVIVLSSCFCSAMFEIIPVIKNLSSGYIIIILTVAISAIAAWVRPIDDTPKAVPAGDGKEAAV